MNRIFFFFLGLLFLTSQPLFADRFEHAGWPCGSAGEYDCVGRCLPKVDIVKALGDDKCDYTAPMDLDCGAFMYDYGACGGNMEVNPKFSGWWYDSKAPGTGLSIENEYVDGKLVIGLFSYYDDSHKPLWLSAVCDHVGDDNSSSTSYEGDLYYWNGWPLGSEYSKPTPHKVGRIRISQKDTHSESIDVSYAITESGNWLGGEVFSKVGESRDLDLVSFLPSVVKTQGRSPYGVSGWWWNPSFEGMGIYLQPFGGKAFAVWYNYGPDGKPFWYTCFGDLPDWTETGESIHETHLTCNMTKWNGGSSFGSAEYLAPSSEVVGQATLSFHRIAHLSPTLTLDSPFGTYSFERFYLK